jgi:hypothetical protein
VKEEAQRENAERVRRAEQYRIKETERSIEDKDRRYDEKRQSAEQQQKMRLAYQIARAKQEEALQAKLNARAHQELQSLGSARATPAALATALEAYEPVRHEPPPPRMRPRGREGRRDAGGGGGEGDGAGGGEAAVLETARDGRRRRREAGSEAAEPALATAPHGDTRADSAAATADGGYGRSTQQLKAYAAIERLRARQNAELRAAVEAEQLKEAERARILEATADGADKTRLLKLLKLERERADSELMALTAEHELALAEQFAKLGVTR